MIKLPKMQKNEIEELIRSQTLCRIAFKGDEYPYLAPFQYVFMNRRIYFHFTNYGRKMKLLERDKQVCVEIEKYLPDLSEYSFVSLTGKLKIVTDPRERSEVIKKMSKDGEQKLSKNFLAVHGLEKEGGWSSLNPDKPFVIVKLEEIADEVGLKSP
jgi:nitroimidazol reductase NimA-like FMN-containing flavoprotein (pyridoxamine 5'-phosphate oxidase superfamily)